MKKVDVHISDIINSQRIDVAYFTEKNGVASFVPLSKYVEIKGGKRIPKGKSFSQEKTNYLYLRLSEIDESGIINYDALKCISEDLFNTLQRYEIKNDQVVFSIAGTIGKVFVMKDIPADKRIVLTENCAKIQPKTEQVLSDFISILLNCGFVQKQIERNKIQTTIPKIGLDRIAKLKIPEIPSLDYQKKIITIYQNAQKARLNKNNEAKQLLDGIEDYIANKLQLNTIRKRGEKHQPFTLKSTSLFGSRFDVQFHAGIKDAIRQTEEVPYKALGEIAAFTSEGWNQKSIFNDKFPYIEISSINTTVGCIEDISSVSLNDPPSRAKKIVRRDDILISTTRPNRGAICIYDCDNISIASTGFSVIRETDNCVRKEYLYLALRLSSSLEQMSLRCSGGNYPAITESELKKILIPIPSITIQEDIIETVAKTRNKARLLQEQGNQLMEEANHKIENIILG